MISIKDIAYIKTIFAVNFQYPFFISKYVNLFSSTIKQKIRKPPNDITNSSVLFSLVILYVKHNMCSSIKTSSKWFDGIKMPWNDFNHFIIRDQTHANFIKKDHLIMFKFYQLNEIPFPFVFVFTIIENNEFRLILPKWLFIFKPHGISSCNWNKYNLKTFIKLFIMYNCF